MPELTVPELTLGWGVLDWGSKYLAQPDGENMGDMWKYTREQAMFVLNFYEVDKRGKFTNRRALIERAKGWGKALALDTPIATPTGWTTMGKLNTGDHVFDDNGNPTRVVAKSEIFYDTDCYTAGFTEGDSITCSGNHVWKFEDLNRGYGETVFTAADLVGMVVNANGAKRFRFKPVRLNTPSTDLPIDPYILGYWLGYGDSDAGRITTADEFVIGQFVAAGYEVKDKGKYRYSVIGLRKQLRILGVLGNKHIPSEYLRSSYTDRLALLQGLMDSDGCIDKFGTAEFTQMRGPVARLASELLWSLGIKHSSKDYFAKLYGVNVGVKTRIKFTPKGSFDVFRLPRKLERVKLSKDVVLDNRHVSSVVQVDTVPTVCIQVEVASGMFLAGRTMVPTHNSPLLAALCSTELLGPVCFSHWGDDGQPVGKPFPTPRIQIAAVSEAQTDNTMSLVIEMLGQGIACDHYNVDIGRSRILTDHGRLEPVTANAKSREGQRPTFAVLDETHLWLNSNHGVDLANTVRRNLGKIRGRSIETTNAFIPGENSVAEISYNYYQDILAGRVKDPGLLYDSRSAPVGTSYRGDDRRAGLVQAYGDACEENGGWVDLGRIEQEMDDPATTEPDGRRFYFNQVVKGYSRWVDPARWETLKSHSVTSFKEPIALGFDGSIRNDSTALVACRISDGFIWPIQVWEKPDGAGKDWEVPFLEVDKVVRETLDKYNVLWVYADPAYWQDIVGRWSLDYEDVVYEFWTHRKAMMARAIERFETAINTAQLSYSDRPEHNVLTRHVLNAHADDSPSGKLIRKEFPMSKSKIDCAMAAVLAFEARAAAVTDGRLTKAVSTDVYSF